MSPLIHAPTSPPSSSGYPPLNVCVSFVINAVESWSSSSTCWWNLFAERGGGSNQPHLICSPHISTSRRLLRENVGDYLFTINVAGVVEIVVEHEKDFIVEKSTTVEFSSPPPATVWDA